MNFEQIYYPESRWGGFTDVDGTIAFYMRVAALMSPRSVLLDVGCGRGAYGEDVVPVRRELRIFKGKVHKVIGIDIDKASEINPFIDEFHLLNDRHWSLADASVDICICDNVLEHMEMPESFFSESRRVLKDGGYLCIRTPNLWGYVALLSKVIPDRFHAKVLAKVQEGRKEEDVFPTFYRCNTLPKMRAVLSKYGFEHTVYGYEAEPSYLSFLRLNYWFGVMHQKFAPRFLRLAIFAFAQVRKHDTEEVTPTANISQKC